MALLIECPSCRNRNSLKNISCNCGKTLRKASGKVYWIEYYLAGSRKRERIGSSKQAAENRLRKVKTAKAEKRHIRKNFNSEINLKQLRDWYLNLDEVKQLSSHDRIEVLTRHIMRIFGKQILIEEIIPDKVSLYREKRKKEFCIPYPEKHPSETTIKREVSALKTMLNKGVRYSIIDSNPIKYVPLLKEDNVRERVLTEDEFQKLLNEAEDHLKPVLPSVVGLDGAGLVEAVGPGVDGFKAGDRVCSGRCECLLGRDTKPRLRFGSKLPLGTGTDDCHGWARIEAGVPARTILREGVAAIRFCHV